MKYLWQITSTNTQIFDLSNRLTVTTTGDGQPNLVIRPNVLVAGAQYTFALTVTYQGRSASANLQAIMNAVHGPRERAHTHRH